MFVTTTEDRRIEAHPPNDSTVYSLLRLSPPSTKHVDSEMSSDKMLSAKRVEEMDTKEELKAWTPMELFMKEEKLMLTEAAFMYRPM